MHCCVFCSVIVHSCVLCIFCMFGCVLLYILFSSFLVYYCVLGLIYMYVCHFYVHCSIIVYILLIYFWFFDLFACLYTFVYALFIIVYFCILSFAYLFAHYSVVLIYCIIHSCLLKHPLFLHVWLHNFTHWVQLFLYGDILQLMPAQLINLFFSFSLQRWQSWSQWNKSTQSITLWGDKMIVKTINFCSLWWSCQLSHGAERDNT